MKKISKEAKAIFKKWGKEGGDNRKRALSPGRRRWIASQAARVRWGKKESPSPMMESVRLENPSWKDPAYLEEILDQGGLDEWRQMYHRVAEHPFGETARALETVLGSVEIYGATRLWKGLLKNLQGGFDG